MSVNDTDAFVGGTASYLYPLVRGMYNKRKDNIDAFGWNNRFDIGAAVVTADIIWSKSERDEVNLENNTQLYPSPQLDTVALVYNSNGFSTLTPGRDYSNPATLYLSNTIYGSGYGKTPNVVDELESFRLNANLPREIGFFSDFDIGINYAEREKEKRQPEGVISRFDNTRTLRYVVGENITDAQVSYNVGGQLEGL